MKPTVGGLAAGIAGNCSSQVTALSVDAERARAMWAESFAGQGGRSNFYGGEVESLQASRPSNQIRKEYWRASLEGFTIVPRNGLFTLGGDEDTGSRRSLISKQTPKRELQWLRDHVSEARELEGQWIALDGDELLASGSDPMEVLRAAQRKTSTPLLYRIQGSLLPGYVSMGF